MTLCVAITGWDSLENTQFVVVLSSFVISPISGDLLFLSKLFLIKKTIREN
jgi:hypothetical protein